VAVALRISVLLALQVAVKKMRGLLESARALNTTWNCIRSTPIEIRSKNDFECFVRTGVNMPQLVQTPITGVPETEMGQLAKIVTL
jgi:hypothetical protein